MNGPLAPIGDLRRGRYEAFFLLLNDAQHEFALWLRWVGLIPHDPRHAATASSWGIATRRGKPMLALRADYPITQWSANADGISISWHSLTGKGAMGSLGESLTWQLSWPEQHRPEYLYPYAWMYRAPWPKTKYCAPMPSLQISGTIDIAGEQYIVRNASGYVGHLWGTQMAECWAWLQCDTFSDAPGARCEALSAQVRGGPWCTPPLTLVTFTIDNATYVFNRLRSWRAQTEWSSAGWHVETENGRYRLHLECDAPHASVVGLTYCAPDLSRRYCYHSDVAHLRVELSEKVHGTWRICHQLTSPASARFEQVSRQPDPALPLHL